MHDAALSPRSAFAGAALTQPGAGVLVTDRDGLGLATVIARRRQGVALNARVRERYGVDLPSGPSRIEAGSVAFAGTAPGAWLATCKGAPNTFALELREAFGGLASVCDQSDGYAVLRLSGPQVRATLRKMLPIDLHPTAFRPGDVAVTIAAHIGVTVWRLADDDDGVPVFELAAFRSMAASLWHTIDTSAAEYGLSFSNPVS
jgi:sarcosine oxidase subunit gamma